MSTSSRPPRRHESPEFDDLDDLSSEELEAVVFGPDPDAPRRTVGRSGGAPRARRTRRSASSPREGVALKFCFACGEEVDARAEICPHCGVRQPDVRVRSGRPEKDRVTAVLLAFFLGGFGIHKFYLGKPGQGIAYLLFFWTLLPTLIGFVEFVRYLLMDDERFHELYG